MTALGTIKETGKEKVQCAISLHLVGDEALDFYNMFAFGKEEDSDKLDVLKKIFEDYINRRKNTMFNETNFGKAIWN